MVAIAITIANATAGCVKLRYGMPPTETEGTPRKRPGGRSARVRAAVLKGALEELAAVGYASFSLEGVARRAGVHKTTLYRRWGNRDNLLLEAMLERGREQVPIPDTGSLRTDLLELGREIVASIVDAPEVQATARAVASIADRGSPLADASRRFWRTRFQLAGEMVERAISRGEVPPDTDPELVVEALVAPIYFRLLMTGEKLEDDFLESLTELLAAGASARPRRP
jgi:AcrR family transcriptional regulator